MEFLEKDLEQIIFESPNSELRERGLPISGKKLRQVRIGNYGIADLITIERPTHINPMRITIYELKLSDIGIKAFLQALNYYKGIESYVKKSVFFECEIHIILVGKKIDTNSSFIYTPDFIQNFGIFTYQYGFDGIFFDKVYGYKQIEEGF